MNDIFLNEQNLVSKRFCILDDDGESCWLYITKRDSEELIANAFAYNRIPPISKSNIKDYINGPPPIDDSHASTEAQIESPQPAQFSFIWSIDGESVALLSDEKPIAMIIGSEKYGYSKGISVNGPYGHPWDQNIYDTNFTEQTL